MGIPQDGPFELVGEKSDPRYFSRGRRVVITGLGVVSPNGVGKEAYWKSLLDGRSGVKRISRFDPSSLSCQIAAEVKDLDSFYYLLSKELKRELKHLERVALMAILATREALEDAKLYPEELSLEERQGIAVIVGTGGGAVEFAERQYREFFQNGIRKVSPYATVIALVGMLSSEISMAFGLRGMSHVLSNGCTSSTDALGYSYHNIRHGIINTVITGGAEACITPGIMAVFCKMGAVSTHWNSEPERASRPFNIDRDGFVLGEGAWIMVMEEEMQAIERGAHIYGEVIGYGSTCDAYHRVQIMPNGEESARAIALALRDGGIEPDEVDYINLHGTSTPLNDRIETQAIKLLFKERAYAIPGSATKSMIGHPQGACGAAGVTATLLAMEKGFIPPTINYEAPDPECDLDYVPNRARKTEIKVALCNCLSFGSKNSALVIKKHEG